MADYIITLDDDQDASIGTPDYNIGVNYEIPSKSVQYQNLILDSIASQFDGTKTTFDLYVDGEPYTPVNAQGLIISINDVVLSPGVDYNVSGSQIILPTHLQHLVTSSELLLELLLILQEQLILFLIMVQMILLLE